MLVIVRISILMATCVVASLVSGCALHAGVEPEPYATRTVGNCGVKPAYAGGAFRHSSNALYAALGTPRHRGIDLIALESDATQTITGVLAYGAADKVIGDEDVDVYTCRDGEWKTLGTARTDAEGRFALDLSSHKFPAGMHALFAQVVGDGTGVGFVAFVADAHEQVIVSDVDGTLTEGENAIVNTVLFGDDIAHRPRAPEALSALAERGRTVVYMTARGDQYSDVTRRWLAAHGFPPGPLRLARAAVTRPGEQQQKFKVDALRRLRVPIAAAIGNRHSDVAAYSIAGIAADRILIKLPEYTDEVREDLAAHRAIGFRDYRELAALVR
jgi:LNS2-like protein (lipin/Ned1/Smp2)